MKAFERFGAVFGLDREDVLSPEKELQRVEEFSLVVRRQYHIFSVFHKTPSHSYIAARSLSLRSSGSAKSFCQPSARRSKRSAFIMPMR